MSDWQDRQNRLIGADKSALLARSRVAVIGLGGVGGAALEALARCGVGALFVMDADVFEITNLNRQILATRDVVGLAKSDVAALRVGSINPAAQVVAIHERFSADNTAALTAFKPDYVVDAIDSVTAKLALIALCRDLGVPVISCMGTGNRIDAGSFVIGTIEETAGCGCPLARVMRRELKKRGIDGVKVLYAADPPAETADAERTPASVAFVPPVAGYLIAGEVVRDLIGR